MVASGSIRSPEIAAYVAAGDEFLDGELIQERPKRKRNLVEKKKPEPTDRASRIEALKAMPTMTVEDAAFVLGISRASAYVAANQGEIKTKTLGKRVLVLTRPLFQELGVEI